MVLEKEIAELAKDLYAGYRGRFFHPKTVGVMHMGTVVKVHPDGMVSVRFDLDKKTHKTLPDNIPAVRGGRKR